MNNNQKEQYQQNNPNQQYQQNNQNNPNQQYQQNNQYNPNQQYQQNNQYNPNQQYQQNNQYNPNQQYQQPNNDGKDFFDKVTSFILDTPVESEPIAPQDIQENNLISIVAYLGVFFWVPLVAAKKSRFARFHANQGLLLFLLSLALIPLTPIATLIAGCIPIVGGILGVLLPTAVSIAQLGYLVLGIYNCVKGRANELPIIGKFRLIKTVPNVNEIYNNVNNNNYNAPNSYNNIPNNMNTNINSTPVVNVSPNVDNNINLKKDAGFDVEAYSTGKESTGFNANADTAENNTATQETSTDTAEKSSAKPSLNLTKNDSSNS